MACAITKTVGILLVAMMLGPPDDKAKKGENAAPEDKAKSLAAGVLEVQRLCANFEKADSAARTVIDKARVFEREFSALVEIKRVEHAADGAMLLQGSVIAKHPDRDRYRTAAERQKIGDASRKISEARARSAESDIKRHKPLTPEGARGRQSVLRKLQREFKAILDPIRKKEDERRTACEVIPVQVRVAAELSRTIDLQKLVTAESVRMTVTIDKYELGLEPKEVGGRIRVSAFELGAKAISEPVTNKASTSAPVTKKVSTKE